MIYAFIESQKANHRISRMCRALKVSKSGFYSWRGRPPSARARADAILSEKIASIHTDSHETYGVPRIHFELRVLGVRCARKRVARLTVEAGLFECGGRKKYARTALHAHVLGEDNYVLVPPILATTICSWDSHLAVKSTVDGTGPY